MTQNGGQDHLHKRHLQKGSKMNLKSIKKTLGTHTPPREAFMPRLLTPGRAHLEHESRHHLKIDKARIGAQNAHQEALRKTSRASWFAGLASESGGSGVSPGATPKIDPKALLCPPRDLG